MDVVKHSIDELRGKVEVESEAGRGTVIILKLPLTLAIIDGLLVEVAGDKFVVPLFLVEECIELAASHSDKTYGRHIVNLRGEIIPYIILRESFRKKGDRPAIEQIVISNVGGKRIGYVVDKVIGQHQTVLKSLGRVYKNIEEISGATILSDGKVALMLDLEKIAKREELEENRFESDRMFMQA